MKNITLNDDNIQNLEVFSQLLKKDKEFIINAALEEFFANEHKKLLEKNIENDNAMTNLDFDEFWDDVDI